MSYTSLDDLTSTKIKDPSGNDVEFLSLVLKYREELGYNETNDGELAAFIAYAQAFPTSCMNLIDTYDTVGSGAKNFVLLTLALSDIGYKTVGVRLDSGNLAQLSKDVRALFYSVDAKYDKSVFSKSLIFASNDINEEALLSLEQQGHEINAFGIGTHLVTCQRQPALGCVYKLVEISNKPRIKLSQDIIKLLIPSRKNVYRLFGSKGDSLCDVMTTCDEAAPKVGDKYFCRDPFDQNKRVHVIPSQVRELLTLAFDGNKDKDIDNDSNRVLQKCTLSEARSKCERQLQETNPLHTSLSSPGKYPMYVSSILYDYMHDLWQREAPIPEIS
jgi:nicotinate phosphoribosyltransferase